MDPLQKLPAPILEYILSLLPDLPTLYSLHSASPTIFSLLHEEGVLQPLVESILTCNYPSQIEFLLRTLALLRWRLTSSSASTSSNILPTTFRALISPLNQTSRFGRPVPPSYGDVPLPPSTPTPFLCQILSLSIRVHALTHACLHSLLTRCNALRPQHLADPQFLYKRRGSFEAHFRQRDRAKGKFYQPVDVGAPSWAEEKKVERAVWRIVLFNEIKAAVERGVISCDPLNEEEEDVLKCLLDLDPKEFWEKLLIGGEAEEMRTVAEWMFPPGTAVSKTARVPWVNNSMREWEYCCHRERGPARQEEMETERREYGLFYAPGYAFGKQALANLLSSPLRFVDFAVFRPYGFAIWDKRRMMALGFLEDFHRRDVVGGPLLSESNLFFTWQSILTKQQKGKLERKQRERWNKA